MKHLQACRTVLSTTLLSLLAACGGAGSVKASAETTPSAVPNELRVEYAAQALGIDAAQPRLSWQLPAQSGPQAAYQLRVAASPEQLESAALWDSGKQASTSVSQIAYAGPALESRRKYWWQVQTWDAAGHASGWSQAASWEMGLLQPQDWSARWISGRTSVDHDWADSRVAIDFTLTGKSVGVLLHARPVGKTYGEAYLWTLTQDGTQVQLVEQVRRYAGGNSSKVNVNTLHTITVTKAAADWTGKRHQMVIEMRGGKLNTAIDGVAIDSVSDATQPSGTIGFIAGEADAAVIHAVDVQGSVGNFRTDFSDGINPFTGGTLVSDGLKVASGVPDKDLVLPLSAPAPLLRKSFDVGGAVTSARLYVAAGGLPRIMLNGVAVGTAMQDGYTDYSKRVLYRTFDVTAQIKPGANALGIELGRGWYGVTEPNEWYWHMAPWHAAPALRAQLEITLADGSRKVITSGDDWKTTDGPTRHDSVYGGERYDARLVQVGWDIGSFDDAAWFAANVVQGPAGALHAAQQNPIGGTGSIKPLAITEPRPGIYVFDFGRIFAGRLHLKVSGNKGSTVRMVQTEKVNEDGTVAIASGLVDTQLQTDQYTLAGRGMELWSPSFGYRGFRYVQVEGLQVKPSLELLSGEIMHSTVADAGHFESANPLLNKIQAAARYTLQNNMFGNQTDTPTYEKNGWTGDAQASAQASILNFDVARVWTKWLADFRDSQSAKGEIPEIVPSTPFYGYENTPGWGALWGPIPSWDVATFILPWEMYQALGDRQILAQMYDTQKKLVDYTGTYFVPGALNYRNSSNFLLGEYASLMPPGGIIGALRSMPNGPIDATAAAYYYHMLDLLSRSAAMLGKLDDAAQYNELAGQVRDAYNKRYWDEAGEYYKMPPPTAGYAQTPNVLAIAFGLAPQGHEAAVMRRLNDDIIAHKHHLGAGVYAGRYVMNLLADYGYADTAYLVATRTDLPSWGFWIENGLSTMAEGWELSSRSWDHHYWASISTYFYQSLAGLRPLEPGYAKALVKPQIPAGLDWVKASVATPHGELGSEWKLEQGQLTLKVRVPAGLDTEIWLPAASRPAAEPAGAVFLRKENGYSIYQVNTGGAYVFQSKLP